MLLQCFGSFHQKSAVCVAQAKICFIEVFFEIQDYFIIIFCVSYQKDAENTFHEICFNSWSVWFDEIDELILESLMSFPISELKANQRIEVKTERAGD